MILLHRHRFAVSSYHRRLKPVQAEDAVSRGLVMPGLEDVLIGRDFMTQHGLLLIIDGENEVLSLLFPTDSKNRLLRDQVVSILDADE